MRKILNTIFILGVLLVIFTCVPSLVHAQIQDPNCDPVDPGCPIDSGLGLLLLIAGVYGVKRFYFKKPALHS